MTQVSGAWLSAPETQAVFDAFEAEGETLYCVGGCVRNALFGVPVSDVDMCSAVLPERVVSLCTAAGFKAVPTGLEHGTVTVLASGTPFEITTFRKDVATDGRRAVVRFSSNLEDDARRRDFTINALYATRDGTILDPLGGMADLRAGRVRFIDDPTARIREDYLRILRFFRFFARFSTDGPDADTLDAIARNVDGLARLSQERITAELLNLFGLPDPSPAVALMHSVGVLQAVLPGADARFLAPTVHLEASLDLTPDSLLRLAAVAQPDHLQALRLSKTQQKHVRAVQEASVSMATPAALGAQLGQGAGLQALALRWAMAASPIPEGSAERVAWGAEQRFPLRAADLQPGYSGPALGKRLAQLRAAWLASDLTLTKDALGSLPDE